MQAEASGSSQPPPSSVLCGIHRLEVDYLPDRPENEEHHRHEAEGSAPRNDPTIY
jgi:hypothetical protein